MGEHMLTARKKKQPSHGHGGHHGLFEGLIDQKRRNDPASVARRQSLSEQRPVSQGFFAKMWDKYVHPPSSSPFPFCLCYANSFVRNSWVRGVPPNI